MLLTSFFARPTIRHVAAALSPVELPGGIVIESPGVKRVVRASPTQERMWLLAEFDATNCAYNESLALDLRGSLDISALRLSLQDVTARHEAFWCGFRRQDDAIMQVVHVPEPIDVPVIDLTSSPEPAKALASEINSVITEPFSLERAPLLRCVLMRLNDDHHVLQVVQHHIISDESSWAILLDELFEAYAARLAGDEPQLPPVVYQYPDHAEQERRGIINGDTARSLEYWLRELASNPAMHPLPQNTAPGAGPPGMGAEESITLPSELHQRVVALCRARRMTPFMVFSAAFGYVLHRYGGLDELVIGTPVTTRRHPDAFRAVGPFVNTCLLRMDFTGEQTVGGFLERCRSAVIGMLSHAELPFEMLVAQRRATTGSNDTVPFQVMFNMSGTAHPERFQRLPMDVTLTRTHGGQAKFPLSVLVDTTLGRPRVVAEYDKAAFAPAVIRSLLRHYLAAVEGLLAEAGTPLSALNLLNAADRSTLDEWGHGPVRDIGHTATVPALLERRAALQPDAPAVAWRGRQLSYRELNSRANQLARHLRQADIGAEHLVGVLGSRSPQALISVLAVLKSGAAYLPLDPDYPAERLGFMVRDSGAGLVLTHHDAAGQHASADLSLVTGAWVLCVDCAADRIAEQSAEPPVHPPDQRDLAYVIYTSGTTGTPNGVMVEHRSLLNHAYAIVDAFALRPEDRVLQFAAMSFDVSAEEIFPTWLAGGCVEIAPQRLIAVPDLVAHIGSAGVTVANLPSTYWVQWAEERRHTTASALLPTSLRLLVVGSSAVPAGALRDWSAPGADRVSLLNAYGVTEATITSVIEHIVVDADPLGATVPIGRPVANTIARVLDRDLRPVPIGVVGELCIGGPGVARGYVGQPELTAQRFIADPVGPPGSRLYRTGDHVRWLPDGRLEFLGRRDEQVKIRGHRVEPSEVSAVLTEHPGIAQATVGQREGRLVAWVVTTGDGSDATADPETLRRWLEQRLPTYMTPSAWISMEALPCSPNGKIDHARLPDPAATTAAAHATSSPATGLLQKQLVAIWEQVLGRSPIGVHDNFFVLGGDSLTSLRVVTEVRQHGLHLSPQDILARPTIAELSAVVTPARSTSPQRVPQPDDSLVPLTPIQHWFFGLTNPTPQHWHQVVVYEADQHLEVDLLERAAAEIIDRHDALRLRFTHHQGTWQQTVRARGENGPKVVHQVDLSTTPAEDHVSVLDARAAQLQIGRSLADGSLLILVYGTTPDGEPDLLLVSVHHLAVDGPSTAILREELLTAYSQLIAGQAVSLPPPTIPFATWSRWLAGHARSEAVLADHDFWAAQVAPGTRALPVDHVLGPADERSVGIDDLRIDAATTGAIRMAFAGRVQEALLTALGLALADWIGDGELVVDLLDHGRRPDDPSIDVSRTMGWLTTIFPLRIPIAANASPTAALDAISARRRAVPNAGLSYGLLRHGRQDGLPMPPSPAQLCFNYLGLIERAPEALSLRQVPDRPMTVRNAAALRPWPLAFHTAIVGGQLATRVVYSRNLHRQETVAELCQRFAAGLAALAEASHAHP
ncbi:amino acid adenylation domain-containing protein [Micromonospora lupini]|uniref:amino acid adenylation domain-containing protein n=1 Tax=Micromonospora lupini TaxID=285679 RepID=UPI0033E58388